VLDFVAALEAPAPLTLRPAAAAGPRSTAVPAPSTPTPTPLLAQSLPEASDSGGVGDVETPAPRRPWLRLGAVALAILGAAGTVVLVRSEWRGLRTAAPRRAVPAPVWRDTAALRSDSGLERRPPAPMQSAAPAPVQSAPPATSAPAASVPVSTDSAPRRPAAQPGRLFINATPWGLVYLDGVLIGNTPKTDISVAPGTHSLRVARDGFEPFERTLRVGPGEDVRLTDIVLRAVKQ